MVLKRVHVCMGTIRTLLVDDEPIALRVLREELDQFDDIEIVDEAPNGTRALERIADQEPDLVLLDLQMPGMSGFEVIQNLTPPYPTIVIVTAFDQYAIEAFEAGAIDYLLKPVSQDRLARCMDRVRQLLQSAPKASANMAKLQDIAQMVPMARPNKIVGKLGEEYHLLDSSQVLAFQADHELVWIVTRKQRYLATQPLKVIQTKLADLNFARIHRNALVNLDQVAKMAPLSSQRWLLTLNNQQELVVSKRQAQAVRKLLRW